MATKIKVLKYVVELTTELDMNDYDENMTEQQITELEKSNILNGDTSVDELWAVSLTSYDKVTVTTEELEEGDYA